MIARRRGWPGAAAVVVRGGGDGNGMWVVRGWVAGGGSVV